MGSCTVPEARDADGVFFPLFERGGLLAEPDLEVALDRLHADVLRHVGDTLDDDAAMLLIQRRPSPAPPAETSPSRVAHPAPTGGAEVAAEHQSLQSRFGRMTAPPRDTPRLADDL
jgi:hypothetical protein